MAGRRGFLSENTCRSLGIFRTRPCAPPMVTSMKAMSNHALHPDLHGRVAIVTGASRGIGKALAIRLAEQGADVAIAAKSEQSTGKLPGSIHETADAIRALGRRSIAIPTDVRDENAIRNMVDRT